MADRLEQLFQEWHHLGGQVLLAESEDGLVVRSPEEVVAESTAYCRASGRLTWVVLDWLIRNIERVDADRLLRATRRHGDLSVLGLLCDAAQQRRPHAKFARLIAGCKPADKMEPFFHRVAKNRLALRLAQEGALDIFRRWGYVSNELRYL